MKTYRREKVRRTSSVTIAGHVMQPRDANDHRPSGGALDLLLFLMQYKQRNDYSPSIREMQRATGAASTSVVNYFRTKLKAGGWIDWVPHSARTDHLTEKAKAEYGGLSAEAVYDVRDTWHRVLRDHRLERMERRTPQTIRAQG